MRDIHAIRSLLIERLHMGLRSPNVVGSELGILNLMEYITFIDERESEWSAFRARLNASGAFKSTGVAGGFWHVTRQKKSNDIQPASVYALAAYQMGYLSVGGKFDVGRILTASEYDELVKQLDEPFYESVKTNHDIVNMFGQPSLRWGTNDNYPCILLYLSDAEPFEFCYFDCWAEFYKDKSGCMVPKRFGPLPIHRNTRMPAESFSDQFRFTKFGRQLISDSRKNHK